MQELWVWQPLCNLFKITVLIQLPFLFGMTRRFAFFRVCRPYAQPLVCAPRLSGAALGIAQEGVYKKYRFDVRTLCDRNKIATGAVSLLHLLFQAT